MTARPASLIALGAEGPGFHAPGACAQFPDDTAPRWVCVLASDRFLPLRAERNRLADAARSTATRANIITYVVGAAWRALPRFAAKPVLVRSSAGADVGVRIYEWCGISSDASHVATSIVSRGAEAGVRRLRVRSELHDVFTNAPSMQRRSRSPKDPGALCGLRLEKR